MNAVAPPPPQIKPDLINTTHFSASLNCELYDYNNKKFEDSIKELLKKYPHGIPISDDDRELYHIATYHCEPCHVPFSSLISGENGT